MVSSVSNSPSPILWQDSYVRGAPNTHVKVQTWDGGDIIAKPREEVMLNFSFYQEKYSNGFSEEKANANLQKNLTWYEQSIKRATASLKQVQDSGTLASIDKQRVSKDIETVINILKTSREYDQSEMGRYLLGGGKLRLETDEGYTIHFSPKNGEIMSIETSQIDYSSDLKKVTDLKEKYGRF